VAAPDVVVRSSSALKDCLALSSVDTIIQEHVGGAEFGIFYCRRPSDPRGHIFSVTEKTFPAVTGDGRHSLEYLILADDRAVCVARLLFERHHGRLRQVPAAGASIPLVDLGSHCRGAIFLDGREALTPALERRFESIARGFAGFYFGRFDVVRCRRRCGCCSSSRETTRERNGSTRIAGLQDCRIAGSGHSNCRIARRTTRI
jgi:hypothetical protein